MKITAHIPVALVHLSPCRTTFDVEPHEVEVVRLIRWPATRYPDLNRWHYCADIVRHPKLAKEAFCIGLGGLYRVNVVRSINPKWKPPAWPAGAAFIEFSGPAT